MVVMDAYDRDRDPDLLTIGRFARLVGLSIGALRHYDSTGLLVPAEIDHVTGYRRYRREQVATARAIASLRDLDLPLETIHDLLATPDPDERHQLLSRHRARLEARTFRLQRALHFLGTHLDRETPLVTRPAGPPTIDDATHRALGVGLYNHTWDLLELESRTPGQDDELVHTAHASAYHWRFVAQPENLSRGEWLCARVYAVLGRAEPALHHARRCLEINQANGIAGWDIAAAYEALARASAVAGDRKAAEDWRSKARAALDAVTDADDREPIERDLETIPV